MSAQEGEAKSNRTIVLARVPNGVPTKEDFSFVESEIPTAAADGLFVVKTLFISVDPYLRGRMRTGGFKVGGPIIAGLVGRVVESKHAEYAVGDVISFYGAWSLYNVSKGDAAQNIHKITTGDAFPLSYYVGSLGMPGLTAFYGVADILGISDDKEANKGKTLVVSGAAGAVGSQVGQLAKLYGLRVVGTASPGKLSLLKEYGFDAAISYKQDSAALAAEFKEAIPNGVDYYFDNTGGPVTELVFPKLNLGSKVAVCGQIAVYNDSAENETLSKQLLVHLIYSRATVQGFVVSDATPDTKNRFLSQVPKAIISGDLKVRETVFEGFEATLDAFIGLFSGANTGKAVVKIVE